MLSALHATCPKRGRQIKVGWEKQAISSIMSQYLETVRATAKVTTNGYFWNFLNRLNYFHLVLYSRQYLSMDNKRLFTGKLILELKKQNVFLTFF